MDSTLRPRDIQARIRAGETAEQVAAAAGSSVEAIMPYAAPVLAERAHQAQTALRASVRRGASPGGGARTLGQCVEQFLVDHGLHDEDLDWDSWRRPDGKWALVAQLRLEGRDRTFELSHDLQGRYVVAENDDARLLTGETGAAAPAAAGAAPVRRLTSVEDDDALGVDAIELVRDHEEVPEETPDETPDEPTVEVPAEAEAPEEQPALDLGAEHEQPEATAGESDEAREKRKRKGRASVPSWDEIMFGGGSPRD